MADPTNLEQLKEALERELKGPQTDFGAILQLANEISREEEGVVRFQTDAAIVRRLGRELVAKQETALGELVKNAYDADATRCTVNLFEAAGLTGFEIIDDGNGMTYAEIVNGFMRLASDEKVTNPVSPRYGRSRAGKKGIGRFATERLGVFLTIVTQTEHESHGWTMDIDWDEFVQGSDISQISNSIRPSPKEAPKGTRLSIHGLHDSWSDTDLKRVFRYLSTLIQPPLEGLEPASAAARTPASAKSDPGFVVEMTRGGSLISEPRVVANADTEVLGNALAVITAEIDASGNTTWSMVCPRFDIDEKDKRAGLDKTNSAPLTHAHDVQMRAYYFIRRSEFLGHSTTAISEMLNERGGIRLYRNGYRVPPYGEPGDDWLGLDSKNSKTYAPISTKAFLGFVALQDLQGASFEETSSREGLIESDALQEVRDIMSQILEAAVRRIESKRGLGRKPRDRQDPKSGARAAEDIEKSIEELRTVLLATEEAEERSPQGQRDVSASLLRLANAAKVAVEIAQERDEFLEEVNLMRILASMGLTIAEFTHDFSHLAETMELNLNALEANSSDQSPVFQQQMDRFRGQFRQVRAYTSHFGSMMKSNSVRELQSIDLYDFARSFKEDLAAMFTKRGLQLDVPRPADYSLCTIPMHASEWSSILLNLLTNSIKAADRVGRAGHFSITVGRARPGEIFLQFNDNGDGIPAENRGQIFDAFFTTGGGSPVRASEAAQAIGTGLGLKIVADIASSVGGRVEVIDPLDGFTTSIRVSVPETKDQTETPS